MKVKSMASGANGIADDGAYKTKYRDMKRRIRELEDSNDEFCLKLERAKKAIQRLKVERKILFEKLEIMGVNELNNSSDGETSLSEESEDTSNNNISGNKNKKGGSSVKKSASKKSAPKKPKNAFLLFAQNDQQEKKDKNGPSSASAEKSKEINQKWKNLDEGEKKVFYDMYENDKSRYEGELADYSTTDHQGNNNFDSVQSENIEDAMDEEIEEEEIDL